MTIQSHRAFGDILRRARKESKLTIQDIAEHLGLTVGYLSDIERGRRDPLKEEDIDRVCELLNGEWREVLFDAAVTARGAITLRLSETVGEQAKFAAALLRKWRDLSPEHLRRIGRALEEDEG